MQPNRLPQEEATPTYALRTFDPIELRAAFGQFATGVTVITTLDADGAPVGLTVNSFSSLSLDPPLVLWSLRKASAKLAAFKASACWAIHVLSASQKALSERFASGSANPFQNLACRPGVGNVPLIDGCAARFQCRAVHEYAGGDHVIFVGEVTAFERGDDLPLLYHAGRYAALSGSLR